MGDRPESSLDEDARRLHERIVALARNHDHRALYDLATDPANRTLLGALPHDTRRRSELHLDAAVRWATRQAETARRRLDEATAALDQFDIDLAAGLLKRVDQRFLDDDGRKHKDDLLLRLSGRKLELEELEEATADLAPREPPRRRRRWWRR